RSRPSRRLDDRRVDLYRGADPPELAHRRAKGERPDRVPGDPERRPATARIVRRGGRLRTEGTRADQRRERAYPVGDDPEQVSTHGRTWLPFRLAIHRSFSCYGVRRYNTAITHERQHHRVTLRHD